MRIHHSTLRRSKAFQQQNKRHMSPRRRHGFTLIEALLLIIVFLLAIVLLQITSTDCCGEGFTTMCSNNLRGIGQAMYIYAQDDPQSFPAIAGRRNDGLMRIFDPEDRVTMQNMFSVPSPTVDMWTVVRANNVMPDQFICPWTNDEPDPAMFMDDFYDFLGPENLSYAYQFQHDEDKRILSTSSAPTEVLMADSNPYIKGGVGGDFFADRLSADLGNSTNHRSRQRGQNILFQDGHVDLFGTPAAGLFGLVDPAIEEGFGRDNIYTVHDNLPDAQVDPGLAAPTASWCDLGSRSDACLVP